LWGLYSPLGRGVIGPLRIDHVHGWSNRSVVTMLYICHDCEVSPKLLANKGLVQQKEEEKHTICYCADVVESINHMKLLLENAATV